MKKTYISPAVQIDYSSTIDIIAVSMRINDGNSIDNPDDILVKENSGPSDVNVWDDEW